MNNKKVRTVLGVLFAIPHILSAQSNERKLQFEVGYSYSATNQSLLNVGAYRSPKFALHTVYYGLTYMHPISKTLALSTGVQLVENGFKSFNYFPGRTVNVTIDYQYRLEYIQLPISCVKYLPSKLSASICWIFQTGIYCGYLFEGNYRIKQVDELKNTPSTYLYYNKALTINNKFNRYDWGVTLSVTRQLNRFFALRVSMQKGFIATNISGFAEQKYNQNFMVGMQYNVL